MSILRYSTITSCSLRVLMDFRRMLGKSLVCPFRLRSDSIGDISRCRTGRRDWKPGNKNFTRGRLQIGLWPLEDTLSPPKPRIPQLHR
ncbi:hypothetical protein Zmor_004954 [Zophobas morio]|uniref:Uncharacterized protein n=1 Tax=Zophobas morio TaxID=2755281 RepID=A0AA38IWZ3_9CUCU|nr:hypothetical protein Zmor_004954 [Zophobas morio]